MAYIMGVGCMWGFFGGGRVFFLGGWGGGLRTKPNTQQHPTYTHNPLKHFLSFLGDPVFLSFAGFSFQPRQHMQPFQKPTRT